MRTVIDSIRFDDPVAVFGHGSVRIDSFPGQGTEDLFRPILEGGGPAAGSPVYQIAVLLLFVAYCWAVRVYLLQSGRVVHALRNVEITESEGVERSARFDRALRGLNWALGLALAVFVAKAVGEWLESLDTSVAFWGVPLVGLLLAAARVWQRLVFALVGRVTFRSDFVQTLNALRRMVTSLTALVLIPVVLLYAFAGGWIERVLFWIVTVLIAAGIAGFAARTFRYFTRRKVSILHWILYLCVVEAFPYSFVVLAVLRRDMCAF